MKEDLVIIQLFSFAKKLFASVSTRLYFSPMRTLTTLVNHTIPWFQDHLSVFSRDENVFFFLV
jgi:hypothetical protein